MHVGMWVYIPADFDFRAEPGFLKMLRFSRSVNSGQKMEVQPASIDGSQSGWNLQDETFQTAEQSYTLRDSSRVLIRGQWNFIAFSAYLSDVSSELIKRLWRTGTTAGGRQLTLQQLQAMVILEHLTVLLTQ
jgi:hypothetical protein